VQITRLLETPLEQMGKEKLSYLARMSTSEILAKVENVRSTSTSIPLRPIRPEEPGVSLAAPGGRRWAEQGVMTGAARGHPLAEGRAVRPVVIPPSAYQSSAMPMQSSAFT
jgi:hypothetical protein